MSSASDGRVKDAERRLAELEQEVVRVRVLEAQYKQEATLVCSLLGSFIVTNLLI